MPWFNKQNGSGTAGRPSPLGTTGVKYRSASSTQRALEELRRKRLEAQEKRRATGVLLALLALAGLVQRASTGGGWNPWGSTVTETALRGSRDKVYGATKDLGYGGERTGSVPAAKAAPVPVKEGAATDSKQVEEGYTYALPDPVEKIYDDEQQYLLPLRHFADVSDPSRPTDTAFFFKVPRAGSVTMMDIMGKCLHLVQSTEVGVGDGHGKDPQLQVLQVQQNRYVNVDTTQVPGIQRAVDLGLASSGLADVIVSSYLHESAPLFDLKHQGRAFIVFRDPLVRAMSMYWHRVKTVGDLDPNLAIVDYAQGNGIENNWMCRFLTNRMEGELTKPDLDKAMQILKDKFLVGFMDDLEESVARVMKYQGWSLSVADETERMKQEDCVRDLAMKGGGANIGAYEYEIPKRGSQAHALISWQTQFDTKLYAYAKELFEKQTKEWGTKERKKQLKKEKKQKKDGGK